MCGIVGYVGLQSANPILMEGLRRLEYRGYDSAGIAWQSDGEIHLLRAPGKLHNLQARLPNTVSHLGIGHTRWATHGKPEERNAHPHCDNQHQVAVVQNGIIENYRPLREELIAQGCVFRSDTDTEVIPHLLSQYLQNNYALLEAMRLTVVRLEGAFAIAAIATAAPDEIVIARQQAPLVVGLGQGELFCASDTTALINHTQAFLSLENGELARLTPLGMELYSFAGERVRRFPERLTWSPVLVEKGGFKHYMLKEIHDQPGVLRQGLESHLLNAQIALGPVQELYPQVEQMQIVACGTSWHASLVGQYILQQVAQVPTTVHYASEFRYAPPPYRPHTLTIGVTQSGETADTLAALSLEASRQLTGTPWLLGITNRPESSLGRLVPYVIDTRAGIEIGVAATKTFIAQVTAFYLLAFDLAYQRQIITQEKLELYLANLQKIPNQLEWILETQTPAIEQLAYQFQEVQHVIYLGRGINFPIALEGALKLKEISYIHAEGYPAGEMKHGPIALLDKGVPVIAIATPGTVYDKVLSNVQEARAREAHLIGVGSAANSEIPDLFHVNLTVPEVPELLSPLVTVIPLQLLAYYIAAHRGLDVDQPRNLAKSVTVE
ncbi:D-fructose-6-phosphate amidotransferase [Gloeomargarita lithophora Alchichica-D10]|uniref:Glutamine--fructose-6-phosphate aminotransferase [isomerizing] n=1 Tax=Gloeomargarita lithophora Alchichica-D10 TaxID=1188229 RepID=A0A1J0A9V8_9CYAN|nr:glutamine--fructose-6-phosphate transaminase (isomerizing) [Gloeomargarita lithophora]APB32711.1 D-fructose-6-phosphate amidotransferase [Gloeomargarita lithophora Alchichica-D10]